MIVVLRANMPAVLNRSICCNPSSKAEQHFKASMSGMLGDPKTSLGLFRRVLSTRPWAWRLLNAHLGVGLEAAEHAMHGIEVS
jgi:hypothetical protein